MVLDFINKCSALGTQNVVSFQIKIQGKVKTEKMAPFESRTQDHVIP